MAKSVFLLVYETLAEFEVSVLLTALRSSDHSVTTVGLTQEPVATTGGLRIVPDVSIPEIDASAVDALIIPGGDAAHAVGDAGLRSLVQDLDARAILLAAICGGPAVLGDSGVLDDRHYTAALEPGDAAYGAIDGRGTREPEFVVTDGHVVTAVGSAYLAFAEEVLRHLDDRAAIEPLTYFREPSLA